VLASSSGGELFNAKRSPAIANSGVSLDQGEGTLAVMPVAYIRALRQVGRQANPARPLSWIMLPFDSTPSQASYTVPS
jgi:hypothetical protein